MPTNPEQPKSTVVAVMIATLENNALNFQFLFPPRGPDPGQIVSALHQYLTLMAQRKDQSATPTNS